MTGFLVLWDLAVRFSLIDRVFLPTPTDVAGELVRLLGEPAFVRDVVATVLAWLIAIAVAAAVAVPAGLLLGSLPWLRTATRAMVEFLRPIPPVALIPLVVVIFGSGPDAKITLAVYAAVWPILFNVVYALGEIDPLLLDTARAFGHPPARVLARVALPHVAPFAFTGLRLSAGIALIVVISTEYLAGSEVGVGAFLIEVATSAGGLDLVLAGTVVIGSIGALANEGLERLGQRLFRWSTLVRTKVWP